MTDGLHIPTAPDKSWIWSKNGTPYIKEVVIEISSADTVMIGGVTAKRGKFLPYSGIRIPRATMTEICQKWLAAIQPSAPAVNRQELMDRIWSDIGDLAGYSKYLARAMELLNDEQLQELAPEDIDLGGEDPESDEDSTHVALDHNVLVRDGVKVEWSELGEGVDGDFNPDDPLDEELLRFDIFQLVDGEWEAVDDASYCTQFPASATPEQRRKGLEYIMSFVHGPLVGGMSIKKVCEKLSWISLDTIKENDDSQNAAPAVP